MKIYQTYSGAAQRAYLGSGVIPYDYSGNGGTEYDIFKAIAQSGETGDEPWGVLSWKFEVKTHVALEEFRQTAQAALDNGADCVFINPMNGAEAVFSNVWEQGVACGHAGMEHLIPFLLERGHLRRADLFMPQGVFAFCNYFVARPSFWHRYFEFVDTVLADLQREAQLGSVAGRAYAGPSHYAKNPSLTMKPFVVERLLSTFLPRSGLKICAVDVDLPIYKAKFGNLLGNTLFQLSRLKNGATTEQAAATRQRWQELSNRLIKSRSFLTLMHLDDPDMGIADVGLAAA